MNEAAAPEPDDFWSLRKRLDELNRQAFRPAAEAMFGRAVVAARKAAHLRVLFDLTRETFPRWQHAPVLLSLDAALRGLNEQSAAATSLGLFIPAAIRDYPGFLARYGQASGTGALAPDTPAARRFARLATIVSRPKFPDFQAPKVFGIGLSKSGTTSLDTALESLGLFSAHYNNVFSQQMLSDEDAHIFDAMTDTPVSVQFELLYHRFPNAQFIYTMRPYDSWVGSFLAHCRRLYGTEDFGAIRGLAAKLSHLPYITDFEKVDCALYFRYPDVHVAHAVYEARVRHFFADKPGDKLLRLELGTGREWAKLGAFLQRDVPELPYPWDNKTAPG